MLKYKITVEPTTEPVTTTEALAHCRVTDATEATKMGELITAARAYAEAVTGRAFAVKTVVAVCDKFPTSGVIELPVYPVVSLTSLKYKDEDGVETDITTDVILDDYSTPPRLVLKSSANWPTADLYDVNPITITYQAGASPDKLIKSAMLLLIGHWYENREEVIAGQESYSVPFAAEAILQQSRHPRT